MTIEKIIEREEISSQEELVRKLRGEGISCTQATLSRNLRQLGVLRVPNGRGGYKYSLSGNQKQVSQQGAVLNIISVIRAPPIIRPSESASPVNCGSMALRKVYIRTFISEIPNHLAYLT